jgi:hypothetical protein
MKQERKEEKKENWADMVIYTNVSQPPVRGPQGVRKVIFIDAVLLQVLSFFHHNFYFHIGVKVWWKETVYSIYILVSLYSIGAAVAQVV